MALVDTGALSTCVDIKVAEKLDLAVVDSKPMTSATGTEIMPVYAMKLDFPGNINMVVEQALGARLAPMGIAVLLGRDALQNAIFVYNGPDGSISLSI